MIDVMGISVTPISSAIKYAGSADGIGSSRWNPLDTICGRMYCPRMDRYSRRTL
jgi:hypothetical protein